MNEQTKIRIGNLTAFISFLIGSLIFIGYLTYENDLLLLIGFYYLIIASIVNFCILLWLLFQKSNDTLIQKGLNKSKWTIVANIPIAIAYFSIVMTLLSHLRITLVNKTGETITNIRIVGCDDKSIKQLDPNDKSIQWIEINGDCSVDIKYLLNGVEKQETIVGLPPVPWDSDYNTK